MEEIGFVGLVEFFFNIVFLYISFFYKSWLST